MLRILNTFPRRTGTLSYSSYHSGNTSLLSSIRAQARQLEVECKFLATPAAVAYLRSNGGGSRFDRHENLGKQITHDTYYDQKNELFSRGIYVRRRNGRWEAKIRSGGDFVNSSFTELDGHIQVMEVVEQSLAITADGRRVEEILDPCAEFVTERESWLIDDRFKVDVDTTDFGHIVGEVELTRTLKSVDSEEEETSLRQKMDQEIRDFMRACPEAFPAGRPVGKISAYFSQLSNRKGH